MKNECRLSISMLSCGAANAVVRDGFSQSLCRESGSVVLPAEIGPRIVLTLIDNAAPDRARARKQVEQRIAVVPADRALQRRHILGEALQHLQHRFLVDRKSTRLNSSH